MSDMDHWNSTASMASMLQQQPSCSLLRALFGDVIGSGASSWLGVEGWKDWCSYPPPSDALIEVRGNGEYSNMLCYTKDLSPEFNVAGLEWRLTGIGREELGI